MTADTGYIKIWFDGSEEVMEELKKLVDRTDRQNLFSCGLSWLDDLDHTGEAESMSISYDSISATQEFLAQLLTLLPGLCFEGTLEHSWPTTPCKRTMVSFEGRSGRLQWNERLEEESEDPFSAELPDYEPEEEEEIWIPLTPYD